MELLTNKPFGSLSIDVYTEPSNKEFYMTRRQINDALDYKDDKSLSRIISRHKDVIGEGIKHTIVQLEGDKTVAREIELFDFKKIFQIIRFSSSAKAHEFMEFTALTMEQLLTGKATIEFKAIEDKQAYLSDVKALVTKYKALGIPKTKASVLVQEAALTNTDPNILVLNALKQKEELEREKKRGRIRERVSYIARVYVNNDHDKVWHALATKLRYEIGYNMVYQREKHDKKVAEGKALAKDKPGYLDMIEEKDAFKEAERILKKMVDAYEKETQVS